MTRAQLAQLAEDLKTHGTAAAGLLRDDVRALLPARRADRLWAWLRKHGTLDPLRVAPPTPRQERPTPTEPTPTTPVAPTHVIFGDAHAAPNEGLERFTDMGRIVREVAASSSAPVRVVQIGDWYSFDSLCGAETRARRSDGRVREEIAAGEAALEAFHRGLGPTPDAVTLYLTLGNHDVRVDRLAEDSPWLDGLYDVREAHRRRGWDVRGYREPLRLDGVRYQHDLPARGGGRAISGVNAPRTLLARVHHRESIVVGHSHVLQYVYEGPHVGSAVFGLVVGCWLDHVEEYAGEDNKAWWSGHVVLRGVVHGEPSSVEFHTRTKEIT